MTLPAFKDNFSKQASQYARYRPHYPEHLYAYLAGLTTEHKLAWDCGTGNGQAALGLATHFEKVFASDPSEEQIKQAVALPTITYAVGKAEQSGLESTSADLISIANALHWFDFDTFYEEVNRVLKPGGILAAWCYGNPSQEKETDEVIDTLHDEILGDYWLAENRLVEKRYRTIPFPYPELQTPFFKIEKLLSLEDLTGLFHTWSAVQRYKDRNGKDPVALIETKLKDSWGDPAEQKIFTWELTLKVGRK